MDRTTISIACLDDGVALGRNEAAEYAAVLTAAYLNHPDPGRRARVRRVCNVLLGITGEPGPKVVEGFDAVYERMAGLHDDGGD